MSDSKETKPAPICSDCTICLAGRCALLELQHADELLQRAHAEAASTDYYDTSGEYAHTEHH